MSQDIDNRLQALEDELRRKNQLIADLQWDEILAIVASDYHHDIGKVLSKLSFYLTRLFDACHTNETAQELIPSITEQFELLRHLNNSFSDLLNERLRFQIEIPSLKDWIQTAVRISAPPGRERRRIIDTVISEEAGELRIPCSGLGIVLAKLLRSPHLGFYEKAMVVASSDAENIILTVNFSEARRANGARLPSKDAQSLFPAFISSFMESVSDTLEINDIDYSIATKEDAAQLVMTTPLGEAS